MAGMIHIANTTTTTGTTNTGTITSAIGTTTATTASTSTTNNGDDYDHINIIINNETGKHMQRKQTNQHKSNRKNKKTPSRLVLNEFLTALQSNSCLTAKLRHHSFIAKVCDYEANPHS